MAIFRRSGSDHVPASNAIPSRRPHPGLLRRERRALIRTRDDKLRDLGGLTVEMYRRSSWRDDLLQERCAEVMGIDARLAEIDELLHGGEGTERCTCGASVLRGSHFCPNCGRVLDGTGTDGASLDDTMVEPPPH
jgi:hypothetical protein